MPAKEILDEQRPAGGQPLPPQGKTSAAQGERQREVPRMPHERDESSDSQEQMEPSNARIGQLAHDSLAAGQVDTDKGPALDATYDKVREGAEQPVKGFVP